jgi:hypothetical protein
LNNEYVNFYSLKTISYQFFHTVQLVLDII